MTFDSDKAKAIRRLAESGLTQNDLIDSLKILRLHDTMQTSPEYRTVIVERIIRDDEKRHFGTIAKMHAQVAADIATSRLIMTRMILALTEDIFMAMCAGHKQLDERLAMMEHAIIAGTPFSFEDLFGTEDDDDQDTAAD